MKGLTTYIPSAAMPAAPNQAKFVVFLLKDQHKPVLVPVH